MKIGVPKESAEREMEKDGLYEQALEAQRLCREQEAAARYWRDRAEGAAP